jgi:hypothetical protein
MSLASICHKGVMHVQGGSARVVRSLVTVVNIRLSHSPFCNHACKLFSILQVLFLPFGNPVLSVIASVP